VKRWAVAASMLLAVGVIGCASNDVRQVNMHPGNRPAMVGAYDFDILQEVDGQGCVRTILFFPITPAYTAHGTPVTDTGWGYGTRGAHAAATFDALGKVPGADSMIVTRSMVDGFSIPLIYGSHCAEVWGKAVRLKKAAREDVEAAELTVDAAPPSVIAERQGGWFWTLFQRFFVVFTFD